MGILGWIVLGLIAGALAKAIMPGKDAGGILVTMLLGIVGGILGGFIGKWIFNTGLGDFFDIRTWILSILGAIIVLAIYRWLVGKSKEASS